MVTYETHVDVINKIFNIINTGKFYSLTFIKKSDGQLRYLNGHRKLYKRPDGNEIPIKNIGYDPKNYNLIRIFDRNAPNNITGEKTGGYRAAALENILFIKCGGFLLDFIEENDIINRFPHIVNEIPIIKRKMNINESKSVKTYTLDELKKLIIDSYDMDDFVVNELLNNAYRKNKQLGIINTFKEMTGMIIEYIGGGKYIFKY